jgi:hypothetical protein
MRSAHGKVFNHDDEADGYDAEVRNEKDPIRAAYSNVLEWVVKEARIISTSRVLELGSGTGNLSSRIPRCSELVCVRRKGELVLERSHPPDRALPFQGQDR